MMAKFFVNLKGFDEFKGKLKALPRIIINEIDAELQLATEDMEKGAKRDAPADQATIRDGIGNVKDKELQWSLFSNAYHSPFMEFGTKGRYKPIPGVDASAYKAGGAGKSGKGFYDAILSWVKRKKITGTYSVKTRRRTGNKLDQQIEDEQTAFAIYLSIMRHGVKPHPFFFKQFDTVKPKLIAAIKNILDDKRI